MFDLFDFWDGRDGLIGAEKVGDLCRCLGLNPTQALIMKNGGTTKVGEYMNSPNTSLTLSSKPTICMYHLLMIFI